VATGTAIVAVAAAPADTVAERASIASKEPMVIRSRSVRRIDPLNLIGCERVS
jgi:hypothetical protein